MARATRHVVAAAFVLLLSTALGNFSARAQSSQLCYDVTHSSDFHCGNFTCVYQSQLCDGEPDCADGSDESPHLCQNLVCPFFSFPCGDGRCLDSYQVCEQERREQCSDGRDEDDAGYCAKRRNFTHPHPNDFCPTVMCSGQCLLSETELCNGRRHRTCTNGEDEDEAFCRSRGSCVNAAEMFFCGNGQCVSQRRVCDGTPHCANGMDEDTGMCDERRDNATPVICEADEFSCGDARTCISSYSGQLCDSNNDCPGGEDESAEVCTNTCLTHLGYYKCPLSGRCAHSARMCQGSNLQSAPPECFMSEQQWRETCREIFNERSCQPRRNNSNINMFECGDGQCVQITNVCNGWANCLNGADESAQLCNDNFTCYEETFKCRDRSGKTICISQDMVCDGKPDCPGGGDEEEEMCSARQCDSYYFPCGDGQCISFTSVGDGSEVNCKNGADETEDIYAARLGFGPGKNKSCPTDDYFACNDLKGNCIRSDRVCIPGRRTAQCLTNLDQDPGLCRADRQCSADEFACGNGQCVRLYSVCDGVFSNCDNGADERADVCSRRRECSRDEFPCGNGRQCVPMEYVCNGLKYCVDDSSDESEAACRWKEEQKANSVNSGNSNEKRASTTLFSSIVITSLAVLLQ